MLLQCQPCCVLFSPVCSPTPGHRTECDPTGSACLRGTACLCCQKCMLKHVWRDHLQDLSQTGLHRCSVALHRQVSTLCCWPHGRVTLLLCYFAMGRRQISYGGSNALGPRCSDHCLQARRSTDETSCYCCCPIDRQTHSRSTEHSQSNDAVSGRSVIPVYIVWLVLKVQLLPIQM